jgi:hypothetical protein
MVKRGERYGLAPSRRRPRRRGSRPRARPHCRAAQLLIHFVTDSLRYSVALFRQLQCDRALIKVVNIITRTSHYGSFTITARLLYVMAGSNDRSMRRTVLVSPSAMPSSAASKPGITCPAPIRGPRGHWPAAIVLCFIWRTPCDGSSTARPQGRRVIHHAEPLSMFGIDNHDWDIPGEAHE